MPRRKKTTRARKGDGSIFKMKGCQFYYIRWTDSVPHKTKGGRLTRRRTESTHSTDIEVAQQMLREKLAELGQGRSAPKLGQGNFRDLEQLALLEYDVKGRRSTRRLKTALNHLRDAFGSCKIRSINYERFTRYVLQRRNEGASNSTINAERSAMHVMLKLAKRNGYLSQVPDLGDALPVGNNRREVVIEDEEVVMLLNDAEIPEDIRAVIEFAWLTGWRALDEVTYLEWDQVNMTKGEVRWPFGTTKNSKGRLRAFDPKAEPGTIDAAVRDLLLRWKERATLYKGHKFVFHRNGRRVAKKRWYAVWHAACDRHEIKDVRSPNVGNHKMPHDMRRLATLRYLQSGLSEVETAALTGHESLEMIKRYGVMDAPRQRNATKKVAAPQGVHRLKP
jgi:site-specific recombinase XerC